jgi:hypothetical protein
MIALLRSAYFRGIGALAGGAAYERQNQEQTDEHLHGIPLIVHCADSSRLAPAASPWRATDATLQIGLPAEGLLGAARLAPPGSPFGRSTWPAAKLSNPLVCLSGVRISD